MAGAGYKLFNTGDVLTAAQVNTYLMEQTVMVFANASARTTALSGVLAEGMLSYLKDTNKVYVYDGSAWLDVSSEIPSQTGNSGKYLTTDGTNASWATISAGGMTELASGTLSGTAVNLTSISQSYIDLYLVIVGAYVNSATQLSYRFNSDSGSNYSMNFMYIDSTSLVTEYGLTAMYVTRNNYSTSSNNNSSILYIKNYATTSGKDITGAFANDHPTGAGAFKMFGNYGSTTAISSISIRTLNGTSTFSGGTYKLYGVK